MSAEELERYLVLVDEELADEIQRLRSRLATVEAEVKAPLAYLRRFFPCPHWTTVEAHPGLCANCGMDNGESCPIREACDRIAQAVARRDYP